MPLMHPHRKRRLLALLAIFSCAVAAVSLVFYALGENMNAYYSPCQVAAGEAPLDHTIRLGGLVVDDSLQRRDEDLQVRFAITDLQETINVSYRGILPDLFREGQSVLVTGKIQPDGVLYASQVLAKHDENYMPPEVAETLSMRSGAIELKPCS